MLFLRRTFLEGVGGTAARFLSGGSGTATSTVTAQTIRITVSGVDILILIPAGMPTPAYLVYYHSGVGDDRESLVADGLKQTCVTAFRAAGYILMGISAGNNWGNQAALNAYVTAYNYLASQYSIAGTLIWSQSMGGCAGLLNLSAAAYPNIKGWLGTYPVCSLQNLYSAGTYAGQIDVAYNIPGGGSYATQTAGHDPLLRTAASFPYRMRWYASPGDTVVNEAGNSTAMVALVNGIAIENVLVPCTGDHGDPTHFQPTDYVTFAQRCFA